MLARRRPIALILPLFLLLGLVYSVANPLFESPDEVWHYEYVRWLVEGNGLPRSEQVGEAPWHQEGSQPPLYYLAAALLTSPIPTDNAAEIIRYNPHAAIGQPGSFGNKNVIVHGRADAFPWQGVALAAHLARLFSLLLGAVTVLATYGTALVIFPDRRPVAILAAALVAFNPQFLFLSAAVNNDNLVIAASAAGLWLCVQLLGRTEAPPPGFRVKLTPAMREGTAAIRRPIQKSEIRNQKSESSARRQAGPTGRQLIVLGLLVGVAALSKLSGLALAGLAGLTLLIIALRRSTGTARASRNALRELLGWSLAVGLVALAVAGWWYARNLWLYGDPLGLKAMFDILPRRPEPPTTAELLARAQGIWRSAWAVFGWFNVAAPEWLYGFYTLISLAGLAGLAIVWPLRALVGRIGSFKLQGPLFLQFLLLTIWAGVMFLALLNWAQMRYPQGRLLFPAISAAAVLISLGLANWLPQRLHGALATALGVGLFLLAAIAPIRWIAPAYAQPDLLQAGVALPNPVMADFAGQIRLQGFEIEESELRPGQQLHLTLYWQALQPLDRDTSIFVHLTDENGILQAQRDSYPASGNLATSDWPPDAIIPDAHAVDIPETAPAPHRLRVDVGVYDFANGERLLVAGQDHWTLGYVTLLPRAGQSDAPNPISVNFEDKIELQGFDFDKRVMQAGDDLAVTLWWQALAEPLADYKVFVHLVLPPETTWAQSDEMPQDGAAPTSTWQAGHGLPVEDRHVLTLPAGAPPGIYFVEIGLYDPETLDRLQVNFSDKGIVLGQVKVEENDGNNQ